MLEHAQQSAELATYPAGPTDLPGRGVSGTLLTDPLATTKDTALVRRAIKERWNIPDEKRPVIVNRLLDIVETTSVTVMTKDGPQPVADKADANAIAAARVLVAMEGQNQADQQPIAGTQVAVGVSVTGGPSAQEIAIELLKTAEGRALLEGS